MRNKKVEKTLTNNRRASDKFYQSIIEGEPLDMLQNLPDKMKCSRCGKTSKPTRHSPEGHHRPPYIIVCRSCHIKLDEKDGTKKY